MISNNGETNESCSSNNTETEPKSSTTSSIKRCFLDVNPNSELNKYKQLLINPIETKRFKPSEALNKVRDFLPQMKESTLKLMNDYKERPDLVNMENVEEDEKHIELNLAYVIESDTDDSGDNQCSLKESSTSESSSDNESESNNNSINEIDSLGLGFKVKNQSDISLKIEKKVKKKPLIKIIETNQDDLNEQE